MAISTKNWQANKKKAQDKVYDYDGQDIRPCKSCDVPIFFVKTSARKKMPVVRKTGKSHFIDCPEAKQWRKKKKKK